MLGRNRRSPIPGGLRLWWRIGGAFCLLGALPFRFCFLASQRRGASLVFNGGDFAAILPLRCCGGGGFFAGRFARRLLKADLLRPGCRLIFVASLSDGAEVDIFTPLID